MVIVPQLLLGLRRLKRGMRVVPPKNRHSIALDAPVPNVVARTQDPRTGRIYSVPVTYQDIGYLKQLEMAAFDRNNPGPNCRELYELDRDPHYKERPRK